MSVCNKTCSEVQGVGWVQNTSLEYLNGTQSLLQYN
nr:MAG TPA: hypothetical protein [Caudoviricetes sp.]